MAAPEVGRLYQGVAKESAAFKLMKSMGWEEGQGLGKNKQGISTHVRVAKKFDNTGIGIAEARKEASNWSVNTAVFDAILKNLNVKANEQKPQSAEDPADAKGAIPPKDGTAESKGKKRASSGEDRQTVKSARPQGRYKKREAGKCVKSYSESDLSAILGVAHAAVASKPLRSSPPPAAPASPGRADMDGDSAEKRERMRKKGKDRAVKKEKRRGGKDKGTEESVPAKQLKRSKRSDMKHSQSESALATPAQQVPEACPAPAVPRALPADWWGHRSGFVAGGVLGSAGERQVKERGPGFSEADQEGLYHLVNVSPGLLTGPWGSSYKSEEEEGNTATLGKKGLGTGSLPKKVAGARWKGQKVTFEELDDGSDKDSDKDSSQGRDGEAAERDSSGSGDASAETSAKVGGGKRKRKRVEATREEGGAHAIKWKKILLSVLKKDGASLRMEILLGRAVQKASKLPGGREKDEARLVKTAKAKVQALAGKCLVVDGDVVRMI